MNGELNAWKCQAGKDGWCTLLVHQPASEASEAGAVPALMLQWGLESSPSSPRSRLSMSSINVKLIIINLQWQNWQKKSRYYNINQKFDIDRNRQTFGFLSQSISCRAAPPSPGKKVETINKTIALPCKSILHIINATNPTFWNVSQMHFIIHSKSEKVCGTAFQSKKCA